MTRTVSGYVLCRKHSQGAGFWFCWSVVVSAHPMEKCRLCHRSFPKWMDNTYSQPFPPRESRYSLLPYFTALRQLRGKTSQNKLPVVLVWPKVDIINAGDSRGLKSIRSGLKSPTHCMMPVNFHDGNGLFGRSHVQIAFDIVNIPHLRNYSSGIEQRYLKQRSTATDFIVGQIIGALMQR